MSDTKTAPAPIKIPDPLAGQQTSTESSLSNWAGDYVTDMLGKGQALSNTPYQAYMGPLTAGASTLQDQAFKGVAGLTLPSNMGGYTPQSFTTAGTAQKYMNPYLQASLDPQLAEARRAAEITRMNDAARLAKAGAYGGSRQAIMDSETNRNLGTNLASITGTGYNTAFNNAQNQFNTEQNFGLQAQGANNQYGLAALGKQAELGGVQRGIEGEGIAADYGQFKEERDFPYKQVQYQQSLLQGMPLATQSYNYTQPSTLSNIAGTAGGLTSLYNNLFSDTPAKTPTTTPTTTPAVKAP
jgi:hypothetical protein